MRIVPHVDGYQRKWALSLFFLTVGCILSISAPCVHGQIQNPDFEDGFAGGVANGWTKFNESPGSTTTASEDSSIVRNGSRSQRIEVSAASSNGAYGGIYQVFDTDPGTFYRFTISAWRTFDPYEAWPCEHWVLFLGLNRSGGTRFNDGGTDRFEFPCPKNSWQTQYFEFTATGTSATVFLVGHLKYPLTFTQPVAANFDAGVLEVVAPTPTPEGPTPTGTPTRTPTATPPPTHGPDLITNGDFEAGHGADGVGTGWAKWSTGTGGFWKDCAKLGPLGCGMYGSCNDEPNSIVRQGGKTVLVIEDCIDQIDDIRAKLPDAHIVGRPMDAEQGSWLQDDPEYWGRWFAETKCVGTGQKPNCWIGLNEPGVNADTVGNAERVAQFELARTRRLHELGHRSCVLNLSNGTPDQLHMLDIFRELLEEADYLGYHTGGPIYGGLIVENYPLSLYCRQFKDYLDARGWRMPPVIYTENAVGDWQHHWTGQVVLDDHIAWAGIFTQDPWAMGTCQFLTLSWPGSWSGFSTSQCGTECDVLTDGLGAYNRAHPVDAHAGTRSQQFGNIGPGGFRGGVVQAVDTVPGQWYYLRTWWKYEWFDGPKPPLLLRFGIDRSGQTGDPNAATVSWSANLIEERSWESDIWYRTEGPVQAAGESLSLWLEAENSHPQTSVRVSIDDVSLHAAEFTGEPPSSILLR